MLPELWNAVPGRRFIHLLVESRPLLASVHNLQTCSQRWCDTYPEVDSTDGDARATLGGRKPPVLPSSSRSSGLEIMPSELLHVSALEHRFAGAVALSQYCGG